MCSPGNESSLGIEQLGLPGRGEPERLQPHPANSLPCCWGLLGWRETGQGTLGRPFGLGAAGLCGCPCPQDPCGFWDLCGSPPPAAEVGICCFWLSCCGWGVFYCVLSD